MNKIKSEKEFREILRQLIYVHQSKHSTRLSVWCVFADDDFNKTTEEITKEKNK